MLSLSCASYIKGTRGQTLGWAEVQFSFLTRLTSGLTSDVDLFGCSEILPCLGSYAQSSVLLPHLRCSVLISMGSSLLIPPDYWKAHFSTSRGPGGPFQEGGGPQSLLWRGKSTGDLHGLGEWGMLRARGASRSRKGSASPTIPTESLLFLKDCIPCFLTLLPRYWGHSEDSVSMDTAD